MDWDVVIIFSSLVLVLLGGLYFSYLGRRDAARAVQAIVDKTEVSDPAQATELLLQLKRPPSDLRRGGLMVAVGLATAMMAVILNQPEALRPMLGVACFPTLIGLAYMLFHFRAQRA